MKRQARDRDRTQTTDSTRITVDACEPHLGPVRDDLATDAGPAPETVRNAAPAGESTVVDAAPITLRMLPVEAPRTVRLQLVPFASQNAPAPAAVRVADPEPPKPVPPSMLTMASAADLPVPAKRKSGPPPLPVEVLAEPAVVVRPSITSEALDRQAQTGPRLAPLPRVVAAAPPAGPRSVRPARERAPRRAQLLHGLVAATVAAALMVMGVSVVLLAPSSRREAASPSAALVGENVQSAPVDVTPTASASVAAPSTVVAVPSASASAPATARTIALSSPTLVVGGKAPKNAHVAPAPTPLAPASAPAPTPLPEPTRLGIDLK